MESERDYINKNIILMYNSNICRLCGEQNENGYPLFCRENDEEDFSFLINRCLPFQIADDGKHPRWICGGCHLQVETTVQFFNLIEVGQKSLKELYQFQCRKIEELRQQFRSTHEVNDNEIVSAVLIISDEDNCSTITPSQSSKLTSVPINDSLVKKKRGRPRKSVPNNPQISLLNLNQTDSCNNNNKTPIKRKRGRPKKQNVAESSIKKTRTENIDRSITSTKESPLNNREPSSSCREMEQKSVTNYSTSKISRRPIKPPIRYRGSVHGCEYEKIYSDMEIRNKEDNACANLSVNDGDGNLMNLNDEIINNEDDNVIGFVQSENGESLGDLIVISNLSNNSRTFETTDKINDNIKILNNSNKILINSKQKTIFMCEVCKISFSHENKFLEHRFTHKNVRFECNECLKTFKNKNLLYEHQTNENHYGGGIIEEYFNSQENTDEMYISKNIKKIKSDKMLSASSLSSSSLSSSSLLLLDRNNVISPDFITNLLNDGISQQQNQQHQDQQEKEQQQLNILSQNELNDNENSILQQNDENFGDILTSSLTNYNDDNNKITQNTTISNPTNIISNEIISAPSKDLIKKKYIKNNYFICKLCNNIEQKFSCQSSLNYHIRNKHNDGRIYVCCKCNKNFSSKERLKSHQLTHISAKQFKCEICGKGFKMQTTLIAHESLHTDKKPYACEKCDQKFVHKRSLRLHKFVHEKVKPFNCQICGKSFTQYGNMQEHQRIHTDERPFSCHICNRKFRASSQCKTHIKRHQIERPLKCTNCNKRFINNDELRVHLRRHNNIKPFKCTECNKCFVELQALTKHYRIHTGEKPYECNLCNRKFSDRSNLIKHKKVHANKLKEKLLEQKLQQQQEEKENNEIFNNENNENNDDDDNDKKKNNETVNINNIIPENINDHHDNTQNYINTHNNVTQIEMNNISNTVNNDNLPINTPTITDTTINNFIYDENAKVIIPEWNNLLINNDDNNYCDNNSILLETSSSTTTTTTTSAATSSTTTTTAESTATDYLKNLNDNQIICVTYQNTDNPCEKTTFFVVNTN